MKSEGLEPQIAPISQIRGGHSTPSVKSVQSVVPSLRPRRRAVVSGSFRGWDAKKSYVGPTATSDGLPLSSLALLSVISRLSGRFFGRSQIIRFDLILGRVAAASRAIRRIIGPPQPIPFMLAAEHAR
jgi:hypothetical protein